MQYALNGKIMEMSILIIKLRLNALKKYTIKINKKLVVT
jgi:hypothetical protein